MAADSQRISQANPVVSFSEPPPPPKGSKYPGSGGIKDSPWAQQHISAWQPVLAPRWTILSLPILGLAALAFGITIVLVTNTITECTKKYEFASSALNTEVETIVTIEKADCKGIVAANGDSIPGPVYLYYKLTNFYQNHRRYIFSRNSKQLAGEILSEKDLTDCSPALFANEDEFILTPCGIAAQSVFNDTIQPLKSATEPYHMREGQNDIVWPAALKKKFKNPPENGDLRLHKIKQWLNETIFPNKMENAHFIVWMRDAALPNFRKLYGVLDESVQLPLKVKVQNRYPTAGFNGAKYLVMTNTKWIGGRNLFLGITFIVFGCLLFLIGLFMSIKNKRDPRILGDIRFLRWGKRKRT